MATDPVRIVYVEDDSDNVYALTRRLGRRGYDVAVASDGAAGIATVRKLKPALVLMDMSLPVMDGWEATRRLKADDSTRDIPVIAFTAHAMTSDRDKALEAGCDDYDTKPVELPRLLGKIEALLQKRAAQ
jgi:two-component system, cell cycle response regulator DivK